MDAVDDPLKPIVTPVDLRGGFTPLGPVPHVPPDPDPARGSEAGVRACVRVAGLHRGVDLAMPMVLPESWSISAYEAMLRKLRKKFGDADLIYEAAAERWLEIRQRWGTAIGGEADLIALCLHMVIPRAFDLCRKRAWVGRRRRIPLIDLADPNAEPADTEARNPLEALVSCLGRLPRRERELLRQSYFERRSDRAIAELRLQADRKPRPPGSPEGCRALEAARKAVSRERKAALENLRDRIVAELARGDDLAA